MKLSDTVLFFAPPHSKEEGSKGKVLSLRFTVGEPQMFAAFTVMFSNKHQPHASKLHEPSIHHITKISEFI